MGICKHGPLVSLAIYVHRKYAQYTSLIDLNWGMIMVLKTFLYYICYQNGQFIYQIPKYIYFFFQNTYICICKIMKCWNFTLDVVNQLLKEDMSPLGKKEILRHFKPPSLVLTYLFSPTVFTLFYKISFAKKYPRLKQIKKTFTLWKVF